MRGWQGEEVQRDKKEGTARDEGVLNAKIIALGYLTMNCEHYFD